jgi:hypothetical protein
MTDRTEEIHVLIEVASNYLWSLLRKQIILTTKLLKQKVKLNLMKIKQRIVKYWEVEEDLNRFRARKEVGSDFVGDEADLRAGVNGVHNRNNRFLAGN